ncbi:MAG: T9SS type A sorting domain-containing protein [Cyclobacteriaceae bacterium]
MIKVLFSLLFLLILHVTANGQHSVARQWNEVVLEAIRNDLARPTVHARNLFHISAAMYDSWVIYKGASSENYFLRNFAHEITCELEDFPFTGIREDGIEETLSFAVYRLLKHRFEGSPGELVTFFKADSLIEKLGYDATFTSTDYSQGSASALGNYLASCIINYGLNDSSNETNDYKNTSYLSTNEPLIVDLSGNPDISDPNRWQPLTLEVFIDQGGNIIPGSTPEFLSPEWGSVKAFALMEEDLTTNIRDGYSYQIFHDPGAPPYHGDETDEYYKWGFSLVTAWSSHLDPGDGLLWDISPKSIGNVSDYPDTWAEYVNFYDFENGGDGSIGRTTNPISNSEYVAQMVPRGDYARVLAEFWADGPDSETPPGHWFTILNYVSDHELVEKKLEGVGSTLSDLEWDVKTYFTLGGAMHDAAISAWGIKGWYDYIRPISAIRFLASKGQSSDTEKSNYNEEGIPLVVGLIELIEIGDNLAGSTNENVGKIKVKAWRGPNFIGDETTDMAGVDWILAEDWVPYQRPSFVTPPFAGYVSGHSTYSSAAATVLSRLTGSEYFPGGLGEFEAKAGEFLVFEDGPSVDVVLQWATYQDAADQCSLSRIWGGIHPPADDIPGRKIGLKIGQAAFDLAKEYFIGTALGVFEKKFSVYPIPADNHIFLRSQSTGSYVVYVIDTQGKKLISQVVSVPEYKLELNGIRSGIYILEILSNSSKESLTFVKH